MTHWFVEGRDGEPLTLDGLIGLVRDGDLDAGMRVRAGSDQAWALAGDVLPALFVQPPALAAEGWTDRAPHPWRRYAARITDNFVVGLVTWTIIGFVAYAVAPAEAEAFFTIFDAPGGRILDQMLTLICAIPGNAAMIGLTGLSIGKWIFGVRVLREGRPMGFRRALARELEIWMRGLAFGVPLISLATLANAFSNLKATRTTTWDKRQGNTVVHRPDTDLARVGMIAAAICLVLAVIALQVAMRT